MFTGAHLERMEQITRDLCADFECEPAEFTGEASNVHLLVNFPPKVALSRHYYRANELWSGSYFAGSVDGAPISVLRQYIEQQNRPV
ncbi:IS200/IS605 family transposase [Microbispora amethystogenes]|uniref:IS200/IS605 family transposase n=1 Tax=Microbispora amethystogenes TaxID=1427754 RepID=A0ABQ4FAE1_9ACTN|nr:IS200/IS605 family transposase [Microbispora amethystogenes]